MTKNQDISIKQAIEELLQTNLFKNIERRNNRQFAEKLAVWLLRYIILVSSMKEALKIDLESVLLNIHGERFKQISPQLVISNGVKHVEKTFRH
jgi:arginyl-tRNA synthetase